MRSHLRLLSGSLLLGLSAATFSLAPVAEQLLRLTPARLYFIRILPDRLDYGIFLALILLIGLTAGTAFWASYRHSGVLRRVLEAPFAFLVVMGFAHVFDLHVGRYPSVVNAVVAAWEAVGISGGDGWFVVSMLGGLAVFAVFSRWPWGWMVAKPVLCGAAAVVWWATALAILRPMQPLKEGPTDAARVHTARAIGPGNPVVWIVFDEWDYDLTFRRRDGVVFPEVERLRKQSVFLENVRAAGKSTLMAMPGLLLGQIVKEYRPATASGARFVTVGATESFPGPRTIFDSARQFGYRSGIVGWYHPYCRIFADVVDTCVWDDLRLSFLRPQGSLGERTAASLRESIELENLPFAGPSNATLRHFSTVRMMVEQGSLAASHSGRSFSFLHLPVPHAPFFRLDAGGRLVPLPTRDESYDAGLEALDRALGSVRRAMEQSGVWDEALVVVTSDHPYRHQFEGGYGNGHVPMMIKFPHQTAPVTYSHPFQAVETKSLIEDFMQGTVASPERAVAWLERSTPAAGAQAAKPTAVVSLKKAANW